MTKKIARNALAQSLKILSLALIVVGLASIAFYAASVLPVLGQPDQAVVFWLLPFLFGGLVLSGLGTVLLVLWLLLVSTDQTRSHAQPPDQGDG